MDVARLGLVLAFLFSLQKRSLLEGWLVLSFFVVRKLVGAVIFLSCCLFFNLCWVFFSVLFGETSHTFPSNTSTEFCFGGILFDFVVDLFIFFYFHVRVYAHSHA